MNGKTQMTAGTLIEVIRFFNEASKRAEQSQGLSLFPSGHAALVHRWGSMRFESPEALAQWAITGALSDPAYVKFAPQENAS